MAAKARREREIARTRQDILEAAARAFSRSGFKAATMQDIAKEAGYTAASLYGYFESKEAILNALRQLVLDELAESFLAPFPDELDFRQKLEALFHRQLDFAKRRFDLFALLHAGASLGEGCQDMGRSGFEHRVGLLTEFLTEHASPRTLGGRPPRDGALVITGITSAFFYDWILNGDETPSAERFLSLIDLILHGLSGPGPRDPDEA